RAPAAQPEGPAAVGPRAVHPGRHGEVGAVPAPVVGGRPAACPQAAELERAGRGTAGSEGAGEGHLPAPVDWWAVVADRPVRPPALDVVESPRHAGRTEEITGGGGVPGRGRPRRPRPPLHR